MSFRNARRQMTNQVARNGRNQLKLQKLRDRVKASLNSYMARHQARTEWWKRTFSMPMVGMRWLFAQASSLAHALLNLMGLAPRTRLAPRRFDVIQKDKRGSKARKLNRSLLHEQFEERKLMAGDLYYVDQTVDFVETANGGVFGTVDTGDTVRWVGFNGVDDLGAPDDVSGLFFSSVPAPGNYAFDSIQNAIDTAADGDIIRLAPGTYAENLTINKNVTILGPNSGIPGSGSRLAEASITGWVAITAAGDVVLDGLEFRPSAAVTGSPDALNSVLNIGNGGGTIGKAVKNSIFFSTHFGGEDDLTPGPVSNLRAIMIPPAAVGNIVISNNLITGTSASSGKFDEARWSRGIWTDGGGVNVTIANNQLFSVRTGINLEQCVNHSVTGNTITKAGTGVSFGITPPSLVLTGNTFDDVDTDFNARNVPGGANLDVNGNSSVSPQITLLLGGIAGDTLKGTAGPDFFDGDNFEPGSNVVADDDSFTGRGGDDILNGKLGTDRAVYTIDILPQNAHSVITPDGNSAFFPSTGWKVTAEGTDQLVSVEVVQDVSGRVYRLVGAGAYPSIQAAINASNAGDFVLVPAGTYAEEVDITKSVTLLGAGAGSTTVSGPIGGIGATFLVNANNVTIAGFTITRAGNNTTDWNNVGLNSAGISVASSLTGLLVRDNIVTGNRTGIDINNSSGHTIRNNSITSNRTGMIFRNQTDNLTVVENDITDNWTVGILFLDASSGSNVPVQTALNSTFSNNNLSGNWYGQIVDRQTGGSLPAPGTTNLKNFSGNWFGTNAPVISTLNSTEPGYAAQIPVAYGGAAVPPGGQPDILGPASANFDFTPWLNVGTDTNVETVALRGTFGFQGNFSVLNVDDDSPQVGATGRITEAYNSQTSTGTLKVRAGSYPEIVNTDAGSNKAVTLSLGASPAQVAVNGLSLGSNDTVPIEINGLIAATDYDNFIVTGGVSLGNSILSLSGTHIPAVSDTFTLIDNDSNDPVGGTFAGLPEGATVVFNGLPFKISYSGGSGNDVVLAVSLAEVEFDDGNTSRIEGAVSGGTVPALVVKGDLRVPAANRTVFFTSPSAGSPPASSPTDYSTSSPFRYEIPFGNYTTATVFDLVSLGALTISSDVLIEGDEVFSFGVGPGTGVALKYGTGVDVDNDGFQRSAVNHTILDDEFATISIASLTTITEPGGTQTFSATLTTTPGATLASPVTALVNVVAGGTATAPADYAALGTPLVSFGIGAVSGASVNINITPSNDTLLESPESVLVSLSTATGPVTLSTSTATVVIADNEVGNLTIAGTTSGIEQTVPVNGKFTVSLGAVNDTSGPITVNYSVTGSASLGPDFSIPGSVTIAVGASDATIDVTVSNDSNLENTEFVTLSLLAPVSTGSVTVGSPSVASISITDVEPTTAVITAIAPGTVSEASIASAPRWLVSLDNVNNTGAPITVNYSVLTLSTADDPADYNFLPGSVTIADGQSTAQISLSVINDTIVETDEIIALQLDNVAHPSVTFSTTAATVTILDNDAATVSIAPQGGPSFAESADPVFVVSLSRPSSTATIVTYTLGSAAAPAATSGLDFVAPTGTVSFAIGAVSAFITVDVSDDSLLESSENLAVSLTGTISGDPSITFGTTIATATITDNETATVTVTPTDPNALETGLNTAAFTVALSKVNDSANPITVTYALGGSATNAIDYTSLNGLAVIPVGSSDVVVTLTPSDDITVEANETVTLTLGTNSFGASLTHGSPSNATVTIFDNDSALVSVTTPAPAAQSEATTSRKFTLNLTKPSSTPTVVAYTISGSATSGTDFTALIGSATVPIGVTSFDIPVAVSNDTLLEPSETVVMTLTSISSGDPSIDIDTSLSGNVSTFTITDNTPVTLSLSVTDSTVSEPSNDGQFMISLSGPVSETVTVVYTVTGLATNGTDYATLTGTATIDSSSSTALLNIDVTDDTLVEGAEGVTISLSSFSTPSTISGISFGTTTGSVTIADDDIGVSIAATTPNASEPATNGQFTVSLTQPAATNTVVFYSISGNAANGSDYASLSGSVTVLASQTVATIDISVSDDSLLEVPENVVLTLTSVTGSNAFLNGTTISTVTIADNETPTITIFSNDALGIEAVVSDNAQFVVDLGIVNSTGSDIVVNYSLSGQATSGSDYIANPLGSVTIANNQRSAIIAINVSNDITVESSEDVIASLISANTTLASVSATPSTVVIQDNDSATVSISGTTHGAEGITEVDGQFTVTMTAPSSTDTVVYYSKSGSATATGDYNPEVDGSVTILAGDTTAIIDIFVQDDSVLEPTEDVVLTLTSLGSADPQISIVGTPSATITISDDDSATLSIFASDDSAAEIAGTISSDSGEFTVALSNPSSTDTTVTYAIGGSATNSIDYASLTGTVVIPMGSLTAVIPISVSDDSLLEGPQDVVLSVTAFTGDSDISIDATPDTVVIADNETATVTITKVVDATEDPSITNGSFLVNLGAVNDSGVDLLVTYSIADSADPGTDYVSLAAGSTGVATIANGASTAVITIVPLQDSVVEGPELIELTPSGTNNVNVGVLAIPAVVTITDADTATVTIAKTLDGAEGAVPTNGRFVVSMDKQSSTNTVVFYSVGTGFTPIATPTSDYTALGGSVTIFAGQTNATIDVVVSEDALLEGSEQVRVTLTSLTSDPDITLTAPASRNATVTIADDDKATVTVTAPTATGENTSTTKTFTVSLDKVNNTGSPITLTLASGGSATGTDYTSLSSTVVIATLASSGNATVTITGDTTVEANETLEVSVTGSSNTSAVTLSPTPVGTYTILNDDSASITITGTSGTEGGTNPTFTVRMSQPSDTATTVTYTVTGGSADPLLDITSTVTGTVVLNAGVTTGVVTIAVSNDALLEGPETLNISLSAPVGTPYSAISLGSPTVATVTINDNDTATATVTLAAGTNASDLESVTTRQFVVNLGTVNDTANSITLGYTFGGSASVGTDFTAAPSGSVVIAPGASNATVTLTVSDDSLLESDETAILSLTSTSYSSITIAGAANTITIGNNESAVVTITPNDSSASESSNPGEFTVNLGTVNNTLAPIVVNYSLTGSAGASDYGVVPATVGTVTIGIGQSTAVITINPSDDALLESDEFVVATLLGTSNAAASVSTSPATVTITDNDTATVSISPSATTIVEGASSIFTIALNKVNNTNSPITVTYSSGGDAASPADYASLTGTAVIAVGSSDVQVTVSTSDDVTVEANESVTLTLGTTSNPSVTGSGSSTLFITDNDSATVTVTSSGSVGEPGAGQFVVQLSNPSSTNTTVTIATSGDATSGSDYTALPTTVVLTAGQTLATVSVNVSDDVTLEDDEYLVVTIGSITGDPEISAGSPSVATLTITDTDTAVLTVATGFTVTEAVGTFNFSVNLSNPSDSPTVVFYSLGGNATSGTDYTVGASSVTFAPGETTKLITVSVSDDALLEGSETVSLQVTARTGDADISIGSPAAQTVTITDNDTATVTITASDAAAAEQGSNVGVFRVDLGTTNLTGNDITVTLGIPTGSATSGADYATLPTTVVIPNNSISVFVTLTPSDDNLVESAEVAVVGLVGTSNPAVGVATQTVSTPHNYVTTLSMASPTFNRPLSGVAPGGLSGVGTAVSYGLLTFVPATSGSYTFETTAATLATGISDDTFIVLYQGTFDPLSPLTNFVVANDDAGPGALSSMTFSLTAGTSYTLVTTTFINGQFGPINTQIAGPGSLLINATASVTITDNDTATVSISNGGNGIDPSVGAATNGNFIVSLSKPSATPTTVTYSVASLPNHATSGSDYTALSNTIVIPANSMDATIDVNVSNDVTLEDDELVVVTLTSVAGAPSNITIGSSATASVTILDQDQASITVAVNTATVTEPVAVNDTTRVFTVTLSNPADVATSIGYTLTGSASLGSDYTLTTGLVVIGAGQQTADVTVTVSFDNLLESTETVILTLDNLINSGDVDSTVGSPNSATLSIIDSDTATVSIAGNTNATELGSDGLFVVTIDKVNDTSDPITVTYSVGTSQAVASDYASLTGIATIAPGASTGTITIQASDDVTVESPETLVLTLAVGTSNPSVTTNAGSATISIIDNDSATVSIEKTTDASEPSSNGTFTVKLSAPSSQVETILFGVSGSALPGSDYASLTGSVTVAAGATEATIDVLVSNDTLLESPELVQVTLTGKVGGDPDVTITTVVADKNATVTISDDETAEIQISAVDPTASETPTNNGQFVVNLGKINNTANNITVTYSVLGGTDAAINGTDHATLTGTAVITVGQQNATIDVVGIVDDSIVEANELVRLSLTGSSGGSSVFVDPTVATVTITDNDSATVKIVGTGGTEGSSNGQFVVSLTQPSSTSTTVTYTVTGSGVGVASLGVDYTGLSTLGTAIIPQGSTDVTIAMTISNDTLFEGSETVRVSLTGAVNGDPQITISGTASENTSTVTITDNETPTVTVSLAPSTTALPNLASELESVPTRRFIVNLGAVNNTGSAVTLFHSFSGSASLGSDFTAPTSVVIANGSSDATLTLTISNDLLLESSETAIVTVNSASNTSIVTGASGSITIVDNDTATLTLLANDSTANETPTDNGQFTVTLSKVNDTANAISVTFAVGGDAQQSVDYANFNAYAIIPVGQSVANLNVLPVNDTFVEPTELVVVNLTSLAVANPSISINAAPQTVTILDDDFSAITIAPTTQAGEPSTNGKFTVSLSKPSSTATTITYTVGGDASLGADYGLSGTVGTIVIAASVTEGTIDVNVSNDTILEADELVVLTLTGRTGNAGVTLGSPVAATVTIADDESATISVQASDANAAEVVVERNLAWLGLAGVVGWSEVPDIFGDAVPAVVVNTNASPVALPWSTPLPAGQMLIHAGQENGGKDQVVVRWTAPANGSISGGTLSASMLHTGKVQVFLIKNGVTLASGDTATPFSTPFSGSVIAGDVFEFVVSTKVFGYGATSTQFAANFTFTPTVGTPVVYDAAADLAANSITNANGAWSYGTSATVGGPVTLFRAENPGVYRVQLSQPSYSNTVVEYTLSGSAQAADHSLPVTGSVTIAMGQTEAFITLDVVDDLLLEGDQTVVLTLGAITDGDSNISVTSPTAATVTIVDNESATVSITKVNDAAEPATDGLFLVSLTSPNDSGAPITIIYTVGGDAASPADYAALTGTVTIADGDSTALINVTVSNDITLEANELVVVTLTGDDNAAVSVSSTPATVTITDDDSATLTLIASDPAASEPADDGQFMVSLSAPSSTPTVVLYSVGGSAVGGTHYQTITGSVTIAAGSLTETILIDVIDDDILDIDRDVVLSFTTFTGDPQITFGGPVAATVVISDEDVTTASVTASTPTANESGTPGKFTVSLGKASATQTVLSYTLSGVAANGTDYTSLTGLVTIGALATTVDIMVSPSQDTIFEGPETVVLTLGSLVSGDVDISVPAQSATVTITDDEAPSISFTPTVAAASEAGPVNGQFTVDLGTVNNTGTGISVTLAIGGTAGASDLTSPLTTVVVIPNGSQVVTIDVNVSDDTLLEGSETVVMNITNVTSPSPLSWESTPKTVVIADNDVAVASISNSPSTVGEGAQSTYTVSLSKVNNTGAPITITLSAPTGSANASDTSGFPTTVVIANNSSDVLFTVTAVDDTSVESTEAATVSLTGASNGSVTASGSAVLTITDTDTAGVTIEPVLDGTEGNPIPGRFRVLMSAPSSTPTNVAYSITGSASLGSDYSGPNGNVVLAAGVTSIDIAIAVVDDTIVEVTETVTLKLDSILSGASGVTINTAQDTASVQIIDNDAVVSGRGLFYNGKFGGALDTSKQALLPGQTATFNNYTGYINGVTGLAVDLSGTVGAVTIADLEFTTWNGIAIGGFAAISPAQLAAISVALVPGPGATTRIQITIADGTFTNTWLKVKVKANANTGLNSDDVFYYGSAVGDVGAGNLGNGTVRVNAADLNGVSTNLSPAPNSALVTNSYDITKDGRVNAGDLNAIQTNLQPAGVFKTFVAP